MLQKNVCVGGIHNTFLIIFRFRKHEGKYNYEKVAILRTTFQYGNHYGQHSVWYQVLKDHCCGLVNLFPNLFIRYKIALEPIKNILET